MDARLMLLPLPLAAMKPMVAADSVATALVAGDVVRPAPDCSD